MKNTKTKLGILFLAVGLILISIPFYQEWKQGKDVRALEEALTLISKSGNEEIDLSKIENLAFSADELGEVLQLEIPFINLKQPILGETTDENLNIALTQIKKDQTPGIGNFTIAGHRGFRDGRHFSNLSKVPVGEKVYLHENNKSYVYEITSTEVVDPTHVEVLDNDQDKNEITMITCTVTGLNRIALKGELVEVLEK